MTDSDYAKMGLSKWVWVWEKNGWKQAGGNRPIENLEVMQQLHELIRSMENSLNISVRFWKVDRKDITGADELARRALASRLSLVL